MKQLLAELFIWWNRQTLSVRIFTWLRGDYVGSDEGGNRYFRSRRGDRRWVIYGAAAEASTIPPGWHGWMHHYADTPPNQERYQPRDWQLPHRENLTGTARAYRPDGSILNAKRRPRVTGDYDAWSPE